MAADCGISLVATLPDGWITQLITRFASDARFRHVAVNREESAIGLCSGAYLSGTGNIHSGRMILDYALRGCSSVQLHTFFQLPLEEYPATGGSRTQRALHALIFDPRDGLLAVMLEREAAGTLARRGGELHFLDLIGGN